MGISCLVVLWVALAIVGLLPRLSGISCAISRRGRAVLPLLLLLLRSEATLILILVSRCNRLPHLWTTPRGNVGAAGCDIMTSASTAPRLVSAPAACALAKFSHETGVFGVEIALIAHHALRCTRRRCVRIWLYRAVTSHVTRAATDATNDVSCEVTMFGTVVFAVTQPTTILANLVFVVTESPVGSSELTKLVTLVIILTLGSRRSLLK